MQLIRSLGIRIVGAAALSAAPLAPALPAELRNVIVEVESLSVLSYQTQQGGPGRPPRPLEENRAPAAFPLWYAFHDGALDTFDEGAASTPELAALATESFVDPLIDRYSSAGVVRFVANPPWGMASERLHDPFQPVAREQLVDPEHHRYFSYLAKLVPSDDGFVGNDDPGRIEVFDGQGRFKGPIVIDVYGSDVMDAGVRENDERDIWMFHRQLTEPSAGAASSSPISRHAGYLGSVTTPDAEPRILGVRAPACEGNTAPFCFDIDRVAGDFAQPGFPLFRIRITSGIDGSYSGTWFDPSRAGEGFVLDVSEGVGTARQASLAWYTFAPDGSGRQLWLVGSAPVAYNAATVELFEAQGGRFASTNNPTTVTRTPWGTARIGFARCNQGRVFFTPNSPAYPSGDYAIVRLTPPTAGMAQACGEYSLAAGNPSYEWPYR